MKMKFDYDKTNALAKELGGRIELLMKLHEAAGLTEDDIKAKYFLAMSRALAK